MDHMRSRSRFTGGVLLSDPDCCLTRPEAVMIPGMGKRCSPRLPRNFGYVPSKNVPLKDLLLILDQLCSCLGHTCISLPLWKSTVSAGAPSVPSIPFPAGKCCRLPAEAGLPVCSPGPKSRAGRWRGPSTPDRRLRDWPLRQGGGGGAGRGASAGPAATCRRTSGASEPRDPGCLRARPAPGGRQRRSRSAGRLPGAQGLSATRALPAGPLAGLRSEPLSPTPVPLQGINEKIVSGSELISAALKNASPAPGPGPPGLCRHPAAVAGAAPRRRPRSLGDTWRPRGAAGSPGPPAGRFQSPPGAAAAPGPALSGGSAPPPPGRGRADGGSGPRAGVSCSAGPVASRSRRAGSQGRALLWAEGAGIAGWVGSGPGPRRAAGLAGAWDRPRARAGTDHRPAEQAGAAARAGSLSAAVPRAEGGQGPPAGGAHQRHSGCAVRPLRPGTPPGHIWLTSDGGDAQRAWAEARGAALGPHTALLSPHAGRAIERPRQSRLPWFVIAVSSQSGTGEREATQRPWPARLHEHLADVATGSGASLPNKRPSLSVAGPQATAARRRPRAVPVAQDPSPPWLDVTTEVTRVITA